MATLLRPYSLVYHKISLNAATDGMCSYFVQKIRASDILPTNFESYWVIFGVYSFIEIVLDL